jgi:hypothetical protein
MRRRSGTGIRQSVAAGVVSTHPNRGNNGSSTISYFTSPFAHGAILVAVPKRGRTTALSTGDVK